MKFLCIRDITLTDGINIYELKSGKKYQLADKFVEDLIKEGYAKFLFDMPEQEPYIQNLKGGSSK